MKAICMVAVLGLVAVSGCSETNTVDTDSDKQLNRDISVTKVGDRVTLSVPAMV